MTDSISQVPAIDAHAFAGLEELADGDTVFLVELLGQFLTDAETLVSALVTSAESGDARGVETSSHTLKSASANVGALGLSKLCLELQNRSRDSKLDGCLALARDAEAEFSRVRTELEKRSQGFASQ